MTRSRFVQQNRFLRKSGEPEEGEVVFFFFSNNRHFGTVFCVFCSSSSKSVLRERNYG